MSDVAASTAPFFRNILRDCSVGIVSPPVNPRAYSDLEQPPNRRPTVLKEAGTLESGFDRISRK
jgi:hypothetical protein